MTRICAILLTLLMVAAWPAEARLVAQEVRGIHRLCYYPNPSEREPAPNQFQGRTELYLTVRIGRGEPCPTNYPRPARVRPSQAIPPMARLVRERSEAGLIICEYAYLGRRYSRTRQVGETCSQTPHFVR